MTRRDVAEFAVIAAAGSAVWLVLSTVDIWTGWIASLIVGG